MPNFNFCAQAIGGKNCVFDRILMMNSSEFSAFYFGIANSTSKSLFDGKNLVTWCLYTERKTDVLVCLYLINRSTIARMIANDKKLLPSQKSNKLNFRCKIFFQKFLKSTFLPQKIYSKPNAVVLFTFEQLYRQIFLVILRLNKSNQHFSQVSFPYDFNKPCIYRIHQTNSQHDN